jgi:hypothetical protein
MRASPLRPANPGCTMADADGSLHRRPTCQQILLMRGGHLPSSAPRIRNIRGTLSVRPEGSKSVRFGHPIRLPASVPCSSDRGKKGWATLRGRGEGTAASNQQQQAESSHDLRQDRLSQRRAGGARSTNPRWIHGSQFAPCISNRNGTPTLRQVIPSDIPCLPPASVLR